MSDLFTNRRARGQNYCVFIRNECWQSNSRPPSHQLNINIGPAPNVNRQLKHGTAPRLAESKSKRGLYCRDDLCLNAEFVLISPLCHLTLGPTVLRAFR